MSPTNTAPVNPAESLIQLAAAIASGDLPDPVLRQWFAAAVDRWIEDNEPLEIALGLRGNPCLASARTIYRRAQRNLHLRRACDLCAGSSTWERAVMLAQEIEAFERRDWPWESLSSDLRRALFKARENGPLPRTPRQLSDICTP